MTGFNTFTPSQVLRRDGKFVRIIRSEGELLRYFHTQHSYSADHGLKHEGYALADQTMSEWAETRREHMTPDTIAANERLHAQSVEAYGPNYEAEEAELIKR